MKKIVSRLLIMALVLCSFSFVFAESELESEEFLSPLNSIDSAVYSAEDINQMLDNSDGMDITLDDIDRMQNDNQKVMDYVKQKMTLRGSGGKSLNVPLYQQPDEYTCGPTSMQMILKFLTGTKYNIVGDLDSVGSSPTTDALAAKLNNKLGTTTYTYTNVNNVNTFFNHVIYSIDNSKPLIFNIKPSKTLLPNYVGYTGSVSSGHYIVGRGYYWGQSGSIGTAIVDYSDPHYDTPYGKYTTSASNMYTVIKARAGYIVNAI